jgi:predicted dienelactone hydrolase
MGGNPFGEVIAGLDLDRDPRDLERVSGLQASSGPAFIPPSDAMGAFQQGVTAMKKLIAALMFATAFTAAAEAGDVGFKTMRAAAAHRPSGIETMVWYPAGPGGVEDKIGDNPLFVGVPAMRDAAIPDGRFPLVVISHGSGGNAANLAWLADALAQAGFVVAIPNHPGTTSGDSHPDQTVQIWNRPADLSAVLTAVLDGPDWKGRIDKKHVSLAGFSLGGYAVLAAAGARVNAGDFARYCDGNNEPISDCAWYAKGGVDLHQLDAPRFGQSNADPRFSAVVAIDPALAQAYVPESLAAMAVPALLINLGAPGKIPEGVDAAAIAKLIPGADYRAIADAYHPSFLGECKPNWKEVLAAEGETEPLCDDAGSRSRAAIHEEIAGMVVEFLKETLTD